jgi:hypothetical protein
MQTFIVRISGDSLTARDIQEAIWMSGELSREEISVKQN